MNIFERAARQRYRFNSPNGVVTVEDLFRLPLETLDTIYQNMAKNISKENSLLAPSTTDSEITLGMEIVKYIVESRIEEAKAKEERKLVESRKRKLQKILEQKKEEDLLGKSTEEIEKMLGELD